MKGPSHRSFPTQLHEHVMRTLLYYDIFGYPLNADEVYRFIGLAGIEGQAIHACLSTLKNGKVIYQFGDLFSVNADKSLADRRKKGNAEAQKFLDLARKKAKLISRFPFVRGVLASGSLSKGYMDEKSDIDFFIITEPKRLWIARTLLVLYKRIFLFNSHKHFCVNYFVDEAHLEIEEKNLFTATELATVIPLFGSDQYKELHRSNAWLNAFFPNFQPRSTAGVPDTSSPWLKGFAEKFLNVFFGNFLERFCRQKTLARWKKHYEKVYSREDFDIAFKSKPYASKNHPSNFQRVIMEAYEQKLKLFGISERRSADTEAFSIRMESVLLHSTSDA